MDKKEQKIYCRNEHGNEVYRWLGLCKKCWYRFKPCHKCWAGKGDGMHLPEAHEDLGPAPTDYP